MATVAAQNARKPSPRRRGGRRLLIALALVIVLIVGGIVWLNVAARAEVNVSAALTVYQATASIAHNNSTDFVSASTGTIVQASDSIQTDAKGRAAITLPDGTITRLASATTIKLDAAHFTKSGNLSDVSLTQRIGRTFTNVQHLVTGALHDGERQTYNYSYAGGSVVKASLGYPGSAMKLTVKAPDGQQYFGTGKSPITVTVNNAPPGIYTIYVDGVSGLGTAGEEPFLAVASVEECKSADIAQFGAVHRGYTARDLITAVEQSQTSGVSNLSLTISENTIAGAIISAKGTYNGFSWSGSAVLATLNGSLAIQPTGGTIFGMSVPARQVVEQIAAVIGQAPSNIKPGS